MSKLPPVIGYARVSSKDQADNSNALEQQIARLEARGVDLVLVDSESGREGKEVKRTQYQKLMQGIREGHVKKVIITRLDRLFRSLPSLRKALAEFEHYNCELIALDDNIDMSTPAGKFHINLLGGLAEFESDRLSERILHGKEHFRKQKRASHPPFGYIVNNFKFELDEQPFLSHLSTKETYSKKELALWLINDYFKSKSLNGTCRHYQLTFGYLEFQASGLRRWLLSPILQGDLVYYPKSKNPIITPNLHTPLISKQNAKQIEEIMQFNHKIGGYGQAKGVYSLTGLVKCTCGAGCIVANGYKGKYRYFVCNKSRYKHCLNNKGVRIDKLESAVINSLINKAEQLSQLGKIESTSEPQELTKLRTQLSILTQVQDPDNAIKIAIDSLQNQIANLVDKFSNYNQVKSEREKTLMQTASSLDYWYSLSSQEKQTLFRYFVNYVLICNGNVLEIVLKD